MRLSELLKHLPDAELLGDDAEISAVQFDSRRVGDGAIFVAVPGFNADGHDFLSGAIEAGASAICVQRDHEAKWRSLSGTVPLLVVQDTRVALATIAAALNGFPARRLNVIAITGTDGKTSLSHLLAGVLQAAGEPTGLISTAECRIGDEPIGDSGRFTTPESPEVQAMLKTMADRGCRWAVIEATSHGLALNRLDHMEPDIAVVTNVTTDHLDFHGTAEDYLSAKGRLFEMLGETEPKPSVRKTAVLNADDPSYGFFQARTSATTISYAIDADADVRAASIKPSGWSSLITVDSRGEQFTVRFPSAGVFGVYNALAAVAVADAVGLDRDSVVTALESWHGAPGRMQLIDEGQPFTVIVDFAHAPDSLRRVLGLLRTRTPGRLIALFGCIGERERERRSGMGRVAAELADYTIVTDDNPYTEDRNTILDDIADALRAAGKREGEHFTIIPDRREAIAHALSRALPNDAVLLAGKGHEKKVVMTGGTYDCDDAEVARRILRENFRA